jgi:PAS domain S-box-containing protein
MLERQRRQLIDAQSVGGLGSWEWDIATDVVEWSDELHRIYGSEPGPEPLAFEDFLQRVHPEDRADVEAAVRTAYETCTPFSLEHRVALADGTVRVVHARGEVVEDDDGRPLRMLGTGQDVSERREMQRIKDEFTSVVSHELRTPLTSIRGSLGLLAGGALGALPDRAQRMADIAVSNCDRLVRLINDILDIERVESGRATMQLQPCDAADLLEQSVEMVEAMASAAGIELLPAAEPAPLVADPDRVVQTLTNLLANAIKFSPAGTRVTARCRAREGEVLFEVSDQGRGIPPDKLERIFDRFEQVDASDSRERGGTGLGLAICRSIVEQHNGRIWAQSTVGAGSTLSFVLPAVQEQPPGRSSKGARYERSVEA